MEGGAPHAADRAQVESGSEDGPLGRHVGEAAQQESPCSLLLLDDAEDRLDQALSQPVRLFGGLGGRPGTVAAEHRIMGTYGQTAASLAGSRADAEGWSRLADGARGSVQTQRNAIRLLDAKEPEPPPLGTGKSVALLVIGESVLVIRF